MLNIFGYKGNANQNYIKNQASVAHACDLATQGKDQKNHHSKTKKKTTLRFHLQSESRLSRTQQQMTNVGKDAGKKEHSYTFGRNIC
jgi:bisphosphoglycerate-dependent phosphoglycerate mutase